MKDFIITKIKYHKRALIGLFLVWGTYFIILFSRIIALKSDGLWAGHVNVWSDWALHTSIANTFAFKPLSQWLAFNPMYAGGKATYPFVTDGISGILMRLGFPIEFSFVIPSIFFSFILIAGIYFLGHILFKNKKIAVLSVFLFFLTPSLGFIKYLKELFNSPSFFSAIYPVTEYSRFDKYDWFSGNVITGLLAPQRTFLLGITITIWIIIGLVYSLSKEKLKPQWKNKILLISGALAGLLPIIHPHSFIVLIIISLSITIFFIKKWRLLLWYVIPATIISIILFFTFIYGGIENPSFASWYPGWSGNENLWEWLNMWFWISGISIPLAIVAWSITIREKISHAFFTGIFSVFIVANLFLFQPIRWDNSKLFFWAFLGFAYLGSIFIYWLWNKKGYTIKVIATILLIVITFTGLLEVIHLQNIKNNRHMITNIEDINLGLEIRSNTDPNAIFLTAPTHNHFVMIWGLRQILMGYTAWVWNYGFLYKEREQDLREIYKGDENKKTEELLKKYRISYVVVGSTERNDLKANEDYFSSRFPVAFSNDSNNVYDVRKVWE